MWAVLGESPSSAAFILVLAAGILRGFAGFGSSLLIVPALGLTLGPASAVAIGTLLEGVATLLLFRPALEHADRRMMLLMSPAAAGAIPFGHALLVYLDPTFSNIAISGAVTIMAGLVIAGARLPFPHGNMGHIGAGLLSGFLTGFGSVGGPPLVLYILSVEGMAPKKRASIIAVSSLALVVAFISMALYGLLTHDALKGAAVLAPIFFLGGIIGARLFRIAGDRFFQRVALGALLFAVLGLFAVNLMRALGWGH